jgi:signal transduction histidine kinase
VGNARKFAADAAHRFDLLTTRLGRSVNAAWTVFGVCLALILSLWLGLYAYAAVDRASAYHDAERQTRNYARLLEEHASRTIRVLDQATVYVKSEFERIGPQIDLKQYAARGVFIDRFFNLIAIAGPDGWLITADRDLPRSNIADREHFKVHIADDTGKLFISRPVLGRSSGKWSIQFTRRLNNPDGSFAGVVVASLDPAYFTDFYRALDLGEGSVAQLAGSDGVLRARRGGINDSSSGQDISQSELFRLTSKAESGSQTVPSPLDGVKRLYSFRNLKDYPVTTLVGLPETLVYADFYEHLTVLRMLAGLATALILRAALAVILVFNYQKNAQIALRKNEQDALSASRMKSEFIARMSHELRTPLNGILGFSEYLQSSSESAEHREFAATIHQAGHHLLSLVNTTLDLARIEAGRMEIVGRPEEVAQLVRNVTALHSSFAEGKGLSLVAELDPELPQQIICDATKLTQVLNNLVHNAIKFTPHGGVNLRVRPERGRLLFSVSDTGPGIPAEQQGLLFERFRQLDKAFTTRPHQGSGLGLALAKELVELMGGSIWLESAGGKGSSFFFSLPLRRRLSDPVRDNKPEKP